MTLALVAGGVMGAIFGVIVGLPALRLRTFYFAMTTLGFATIVTQVALAWKERDGRRRRHCRGPDLLLAPFEHGAGASTTCVCFIAGGTGDVDDGSNIALEPITAAR